MTTHVIYEQSSQSTLNFVAALKTESTLYVVGMRGATVNEAVCRETITTPIIVAPLGCDGGSEANSVVRTNCGQTIGLNYWSWEAHICPQGEVCMGPPYLSNGERDEGNDLALLGGVYVYSGVGHRCAVPALTKMLVEMPTVTVSGGCIANGVYEVDRVEAQKSVYVFEFMTYTLRFTPLETGFHLVTTFLGQNQTVFPYVNFGDVICGSLIQFNRAPRPLQLAATTTRVASNYYKALATDEYYLTRACGFGVGRRTFDDGRSFVQGVPEGVPYGGFPIYRTSQGIPIAVSADARFADFDDDCARFYPKSETFTGYGFTGTDGPIYNRFVPGSFSCYAPFPFYENVEVAGTLDERAKQCKMLGGVVATATMDVCVMDSWRTYCKKGWLFFDERCWFKFDVENTAFRVSHQASDAVCKGLNVHASVSTPVTLAVSAWLQRFFVFWKTNAITRVRIEGRRCECYGSDGVEPCGCESPEFPLCTYHIKDNPIYWADIEYHPKTLQLYRDGQAGVPHPVTELSCQCMAGSTGYACGQRTCVSPVLVASSVTESLANPLLAFFKKCYVHGTCWEGNPYRCACLRGFGPEADLLTGLFPNSPCVCPSLTQRGNYTIKIDGEISSASLAVCGGTAQGECVNSKCNCVQRVGVGPAFSGKSCACPVPYYGEAVIAETCNGRGTCCPSTRSP